MNITATRFATKARTWLLIAGLTGLLIAIGLLLGGGFLYIFVGLAVLMNVAGYWFSDRLALKASRAQPVEPGTMPELEDMVQDLARDHREGLQRLLTTRPGVRDVARDPGLLPELRTERDREDRDRAAIEMCGLSEPSAEHLIAHRVVHDAHTQQTVHAKGDRDREERYALREIQTSADGIAHRTYFRRGPFSRRHT